MRFKSVIFQIANQGIECKDYLKYWMYCASDSHDNRACCKRSNVQSDCDLLCEGKAPHICDKVTKDLAKFLGCIGKAKEILSCHKEGLTTETLWKPNHVFATDQATC